MSLKLRKSKVAPPSGCPISACMSLLGGAWTPSVIWYLSEGPRRFGELRADIPPISAKILSARLKALEAKGVVERQLMETSPPGWEYSLTPLGKELVPAIQSIARIGTKLHAATGSARSRKK